MEVAATVEQSEWRFEHEVISFSIRKMREFDALRICSWVPNRAALALVSGDVADSLTAEIVGEWVAKALVAFVVVHDGVDVPVGFCTLSVHELATLPSNYVELCHLVVDPRYALGVRVHESVGFTGKQGVWTTIPRIPCIMAEGPSRRPTVPRECARSEWGACIPPVGRRNALRWPGTRNSAPGVVGGVAERTRRQFDPEGAARGRRGPAGRINAGDEPLR